LGGLQVDGSVVVVGGSGFETRRRLNGAVVRLTSTGTIDATFGGGDGKVIANEVSGQDVLLRTAIDADQNIVAAGYGGPNFEVREAAGRVIWPEATVSRAPGPGRSRRHLASRCLLGQKSAYASLHSLSTRVNAFTAAL
jgi:hypothetical protein